MRQLAAGIRPPATAGYTQQVSARMMQQQASAGYTQQGSLECAGQVHAGLGQQASGGNKREVDEDIFSPWRQLRPTSFPQPPPGPPAAYSLR